MNTIENIEYKPGLTGYSAIGEKGPDGSAGNHIYFVDTPATGLPTIINSTGENMSHNIFKTVDLNDFIIFNDGYICKKTGVGKYGMIITNLLCSDIDLTDYFGNDYYIDKHASDGKIYFNISPDEINHDDTASYELRSKYSNEILSIR